MRTSTDAAARALQCLLEGCSIRSTERLTGLNRNTIMRLLLVAGERSARLMDARMRELNSRYLQVDEIWCYVGKKRRNVRSGDSPEVGDQWIYVAIDAETKLIPSFRIGKRVRPDTWAFLWDLNQRITNRVQLTTDGLNHYTVTVPECFGTDVDFAQLTKMFGDFGQFDGPGSEVLPTTHLGGYIQGPNWRSRSGTYQHFVCGATELDDANGDATIYTADKCVQQEAVASESRCRSALRVLQFLPGSFEFARYPRNGSGACRSHLVDC